MNDCLLSRLDSGFAVYRADDVNAFCDTLKRYENLFTPPLSAKLDIFDYASKLMNNAIVLLLKKGNEPAVAFAAFYANDNVNYIAYLSTIGVAEACKGKRYGKALLLCAEQIAAEKNMKALKLEVKKSNTSAIGFYEHMGYTYFESASDDSFYMIKYLNVKNKS